MSIRQNGWRIIALFMALAHSLSAGISVAFDDISEFTDFTINGLFNEKSAKALLEKHIQSFWNESLKQQLPENASLELVFHDIDLAGEMRPVPMPGQAYSRIISDAFPPRLDFSYRILDSSGDILAEGRDSLLGKDFLFRYRSSTSKRYETFFYEFKMLSAWLKKLSLACGRKTPSGA